MLDNDQKLEIMKEAYRNNYKGSFTELFMQNDPEGNDPELMMPAPNQPTAPTPSAPSPMSPSPSTPENFQPESQKLVQSYKTAAPEDMPMGDAVKDVVQEPLEYKEGGYKLSEYTKIPYDPTVNSSSYIKNYTSNYDDGYKKFEEGGFLEKVKDVKEKLNINKRNLERITKGISLDVSLPQAVKNVFNWRENLAENLSPYSYSGFQKRLFDTIVNDRAELGTQIRNEEEGKESNLYKETGEQTKERIDLMNMMLNRPQVHNTISESQYRPTTSKDKDAVYYSSKQTEEEIINQYIKSDKGWERARIKGSVLGNYTIDRGTDEDGREYISYYDKWNINPTKGLIGDKTIDKIFGMKSPEIYGRVYLDEIK